MTYDITQVRSDIQSYRRRFNAEYEKVYGAPFKTYAASTKAYIQEVILQPHGMRLVEEALRQFQDRIRYIESLIDEDKTISPAAV